MKKKTSAYEKIDCVRQDMDVRDEMNGEWKKGQAAPTPNRLGQGPGRKRFYSKLQDFFCLLPQRGNHYSWLVEHWVIPSGIKSAISLSLLCNKWVKYF
jgi:hypothetical protein